MIKDAYCLQSESTNRNLNIILEDKKKLDGTNKAFFELLKEASKKIVNLESYPFRSQNPGDFGKEIANAKTRVSLFSARIILWRILKWEKSNDDKKTRPIFIFRRYDNFWKKKLQNVLEMDYGVKNSNVEDVLSLLEDEFFYTISKKDNNQQTRYASQSTIYKKDKKVDDNDYNRILSIFLGNN